MAVLRDFESAPILEPEKALFRLLAKVARESWNVTREDVEAASRAGWSDEALYDAITVCALFRFYNTWIDATGVRDLPAAAYDFVAKRMASSGYVPLEKM